MWVLILSPLPHLLSCPVTVTKLMEMHGDNTTEDVGMEMEREEEGEEVAVADE